MTWESGLTRRFEFRLPFVAGAFNVSGGVRGKMARAEAAK